MLTPQDLQEVSFDKATFGGYVMKSVDDFLEPLIDDYLTLYKENAVLKSKMRLLVERLEEYRAGEGQMKAAMDETQQKCDEMIAQAQRRSAELMRQAEQSAQYKSRDLDTAVTGEQERLSRAKAATAEFITAVEAQLAKQQSALDALKSMNLSAAAPAAPAQAGLRNRRAAYDYESESDDARKNRHPTEEEIAAQIEENVEKAVVGIPNPDLSAATRVMPALDLDRRTSEKFADLQFGKNYTPNK